MKKKIKVNKFAILAVLLFVGILSMGASSWLIIDETSGSPTLKLKSSVIISSENEVVSLTMYEDDQSAFSVFKATAERDGITEIVEGTYSFVTTTGSLFGTQRETSKVFSNVEVLFTPKDSTKYETSTIRVSSVTIHAVAHDGNGNYFGNIAYGIKYTTSKNVYVLPGLNKTPGGTATTFTNLYNPTITGLLNDASVTIPSGYKLILPYDSTNYMSQNGTSYSPILVTKVLLKTQLIIKENAELDIGGVLCVTGQGTSGVTSGKFAILEMTNNNAINEPEIISNGTIKAYGYITNPSNDALIKCETGGIFMPYVVYDYGGGSATSGFYMGKVTPFNIFDCPNIHSHLQCNSGVNIITHASLYTGTPESYNIADLKILGKSGALINLKNGTITFKHTPTQGVNWGTTTANSKPTTAATTQVDFNGDAISGVLSMKIQAPILGLLTVSLSDYHLPICCKFDLRFNGNHYYEFSSKYKFLPGAKIFVDDEAQVYINSNASWLLYDGYDQLTSSATSYYPTAQQNMAVECIVNGSIIVDGAIAGTVQSGAIGSLIDISNATLTDSSKEGNGSSLSFSELYVEEQTLNGDLYTVNTDISTLKTPIDKGKYYGFNKDSSYYWIHDSSSFKLDYDHDGISINNTGDYQYTYSISDEKVLTDPTTSQTGVGFAGWFLDKDRNAEKQIFSYSGGNLLRLWNGDATIYGKWEEKSYTINFVNSNAEVSLVSMNIAANEKFNPYSNEQISALMTQFDLDKSASFYFGGWYYDTEYTQKIPEEGIIMDSEKTLYAKWCNKSKISFVTEVSFVESIYLKPGDEFDPYQYDTNFNDESASLTQPKYFVDWYHDSAFINKVTSGLKINENGSNDGEEFVFYAKWEQKRHKIKVSSLSNYSDNDYIGVTTATGESFEYNADNKSTVLYVKGNDRITFSFVDGDGFNSAPTVTYADVTYTSTKIDDNNYQFILDISLEDNSTISYEIQLKVDGKSCIAAGTLITLADGTQKKVEDLVETDTLLVFDHESGEYIAAPILFIERDGWAEYNVINLEFSNGTHNRLIYEHALFDLTLNKYVYITESNYAEFVGHKFAIINGANNGFESVTLNKAYLTTEYTGCYSLVTAYHLNYFIDGLLSIPGGITGLFNYFEYGEGLKYDEEKMQADIKKYGLYTYEDFANYVSYEVFEYAFPAKYFKVSVGKGLMTYEDILALIERYVIEHGLNGAEEETVE